MAGSAATIRGDDGARRCFWATSSLLAAYHDAEWGVPSRDPVHLFEMLTLEGAQAGLSWETILKKRAGYRAAFCEFDARRVARFTSRDVRRLMQTPEIVRNRLKIESTIQNARAVVELGAGFTGLLWSFVDGEPIVNAPRSARGLPAQTPASKAMSKALKGHGFRFVGPTVCYAFMQAVGMVDDHVRTCDWRASRRAR